MKKEKYGLKRLVSILLAAALIFSVGACSKPVDSDETTTELTTAQEISQTVQQTEPSDSVAQRFEPIYDIAHADSVKELIKEWATNGGDKLSSPNITNILLIGEDYVDGSSRSDAAILMSIDRKAKKITLTSFLRDSYTYMNINGQDRYDKTNHTYSWSGPEKLAEVLSDNYKIRIDRYVTVDYEAFIKAVDVIGGIRVEVTQAEADYMNRTSGGNSYRSGQNVLLDGEQALYFARIRKLDGEAERTERQRRIIKAYMTKLRSSSQEEIQSALGTLLPYITTNYSELELLSLAGEAMSGEWLGFEIVSQVAPADDYRRGFSGYKTHTGNLDVWIVDYVAAAREVQLSVYGETNIVLENDRISAIELAKNGKY